MISSSSAPPLRVKSTQSDAGAVLEGERGAVAVALCCVISMEGGGPGSTSGMEKCRLTPGRPIRPL